VGSHFAIRRKVGAFAKWEPKLDCGISRQESHKKTMNYEILFAGVQNQLAGAKITFNCDIFGVDEFLFITKSADFMLNTGTGSLNSKTFFKQISFTLNSLFFRRIRNPDSS
jgi:hypothetical protein